jgi:hypothetical protein
LRSGAFLSERRRDWRASASKGTSKRIAASYDYVAEDGRALFQVVRYEPKSFSQRRHGTEPGTFIWGLNAGEYMRRGPGEDWLLFKDNRFATWPPTKERATFNDARRVLYRLPELVEAVASGCTIYILEGEKDCDNVCALGFSATTNPGGAGKWREEYSQYFRGADVVICGDNDDPGRDHVEKVAASLNGVAKRIRVLDLARVWAECPQTGDISKWIEAGGTADRLKALVEALPDWRAVETEAPRPLMRELPPPDPFPVDALGSVLAPVARAIHDRVQAPLAICAQSVLAAATLVVQSRVDVVLPIGGKRTKPISSYFITIAESGERKTEADYQATWPIRQHEQNLREKYDAKALDHANDREAWDKARAAALKRARGDRAAAKAALDKLGSPPRPPLKPMLTSTEPTWEGLVKQFPDHHPSLGIFSSEGSQFIGGHAMNEENKLRTAGGLSELWDTGSARRVRAGDGAAIFPGRRVTMHLMVQPEVAALLFQDRLLIAQGILSRLLTTAPESAAGKRPPRPEQPETDEILKRYGKVLLDILEQPLLLAKDKTNELQPIALPLSNEAAERWKEFVGHVENQIGPGGSLEQIKGLANKLPEHAARVASVLTVVGNLNAPEVEMMRNGITLAEHYAAEALRLFEAGKVNADLRLAQRLLDWLHQHWQDPAISLPDIYQSGPNSIRDKATAQKMVAILVDHGWLAPIEGGAVVAGRQRREAWRIVKAG